MKILPERGCCEGDPVNSYLFILAIEVLMLRIFNCNNIHPWKSLKNNSHLQDGYADDLSIFLTRLKGSNKKQTDAILYILKEFEDISGLCINISQPKICPFGPLIVPSDSEERKLNKAVLKDTGLEITNEFKLIGIKFTPSLKRVNFNHLQYLSNI